MRFYVAPLTREHLEDIAGWHYAAPYDVYDEPASVATMPLDDIAMRALLTGDGTLAGYFCWGGGGQVNAAADVYAVRSGTLDFGIGMRPSRTGRGEGVWAAGCALAWLRGQFAPEAFRLAVYEWNERARRVYSHLGFVPVTLRGDFLIMMLDERPWQEASRPLQSGMAVYPGDPAFDRHLFAHRENGGFDASVFTMCAHSGTHIDAPSHIGLDGAAETVPLTRLNGPVQLLRWPQDGIGAIHSPRVLLDTQGRALSVEDAQALIAAGVELVGIDVMAIGVPGAEYGVHNALLSAGVTILENAALEAFAPGWYEMRCLPLHMPGSDGAPVRLQLRKEKP